MSVAVRFKAQLSDYSRALAQATWHQAANVILSGDITMLRLAIVIAVAAPLLSGCIIIASEKPTTRVIHTAPAEAAQ